MHTQSPRKSPKALAWLVAGMVLAAAMLVDLPDAPPAPPLDDDFHRRTDDTRRELAPLLEAIRRA